MLAASLCCGTRVSMAQNGGDNYVVIETSGGDYEGRWFFNVAPYEAEFVPGCWVDWNNNGTEDEGEAITEDDWMNSVENDMVSKRITIHGDITYLSLYGLTLTDIDLSHTDVLDFLDVSGNLLENIDLSVNSSIKDLSIGDNPMSSVDLVNAPKLRSLSMSMNQNITEVDLSAQDKLEEFIFTDNENIGSFDFSANPELKFIYLEAVPLKKIDLSPNTKLEELNIAFTSLEDIKLPAGAPIKSIALHNNMLSGTLDLSGYKNLTDIFFQNNNINKLVIDKDLKDLYIISCYMNDLQTDDFMPVIDNLYDRNGMDHGCIFMVDSEPLDEDTADKNSLTTTAVDICMDKAWDTIDYAGANMYPYFGIDDDVTSVNHVHGKQRSIAVTEIAGQPAVKASADLIGRVLNVYDAGGNLLYTRRITSSLTLMPSLKDADGTLLFNVGRETIKVLR